MARFPRRRNRDWPSDNELATLLQDAFGRRAHPSMRARHLAPIVGAPEAEVERVLVRLRDESGLLRRKQGKWQPTEKGRRSAEWVFEPDPASPAPGPWAQWTPCTKGRQSSRYTRTQMGRGHFEEALEVAGTPDPACADRLLHLAGRQAGTFGLAKLYLETENPDSWIHLPHMAAIKDLVLEYASKPSRKDIRRAIKKLRAAPQQTGQGGTLADIEADLRYDLSRGVRPDDPGRGRSSTTDDSEQLLTQYASLAIAGDPEQGVRPAQREKAKDPRRQAAELEAERIVERAQIAIPDEGSWGAFVLAFDELGIRYIPQEDLLSASSWRQDDLEDGNWTGGDATNDDLAEFYDVTEFYRPEDLPRLLGVDWTPLEAGQFLYNQSQSFEPSWLTVQRLADRVYPDPAYGGLRLVEVSKEQACEFIRQHHSALPHCNPKGMMYAIGAELVEPGQLSGTGRLVAVATAGSPGGPFKRAGCDQHGTLDLDRVAAAGGIMGASSMLASRMMDLLPVSGRVGNDGRRRVGCRFVTYSMAQERGTTYLSLVSKGLRPVDYNKGEDATGARSTSGTTAKAQVDKIVWMSGPAAEPPKWSVLEGGTPPEQIAKARSKFIEFDLRDIRKRIKQLGRAGLPKLWTRTRMAEEDGHYLQLAKMGLRPVELKEGLAGAELYWEAGPKARKADWNLLSKQITKKTAKKNKIPAERIVAETDKKVRVLKPGIERKAYLQALKDFDGWKMRAEQAEEKRQQGLDRQEAQRSDRRARERAARPPLPDAPAHGQPPVQARLIANPRRYAQLKRQLMR